MAATGPAIILVRPQLGENIGKAARAMLNFGLEELRLVAPRDGWPNPDAGPAASGADSVLDRAGLYETVEEAVADLQHVYAATVRERPMVKRVVTPGEAAREQRDMIGRGEACGILFGPEKAGLTNEDLVLADTVWTAATNPDFSSLNLAQAVLIAAYEWSSTADEGLVDIAEGWKEEPPASKADLQALFDHLEGELDARNHFRPAERRPVMVRSLRNMLQNAHLTEQQVRTLRGVIKSLAGEPAKAKRRAKGAAGDE